MSYTADEIAMKLISMERKYDTLKESHDRMRSMLQNIYAEIEEGLTVEFTEDDQGIMANILVKADEL